MYLLQYSPEELAHRQAVSEIEIAVIAGLIVIFIGWIAKRIYAHRHKVKAAGVSAANTAQVTLSHSPVGGHVAGRDVNVQQFYGASHEKLKEEESLDYRSTPTPTEMFERIRALPIYEQENAAKTYIDFLVEWPTRLIGLKLNRHTQNNYDLHLAYGIDDSIFCENIDLARYPRLKAAHQGQSLTVRGTIESLSTAGRIVSLKDAHFAFRPEDSCDADNILHEIKFDYLPASPLNNGWKPADNVTPRFHRATQFPGGLYMQVDGQVFAMDYSIAQNFKWADRVKFNCEFHREAKFYTEIEVPKDIGSSDFENWYFQHVPGDKNRAPIKDKRDREWLFYVEPIDGKTEFEIDLRRELAQVLPGKSFEGLKSIRIRGDIVLSPIKLIRA